MHEVIHAGTPTKSPNQLRPKLVVPNEFERRNELPFEAESVWALCYNISISSFAAIGITGALIYDDAMIIPC